MAVTMRGNYIFVSPGEKAYKVASNLTNYLELGVENVTAYYLEASVIANDYSISGTLLGPTGGVCEIDSNFPLKSEFRREMLPNGYRIYEPDGGLLLGMELLQPEMCLIRGRIFDNDGSIVAEDEGDDFLVYKGPAVLGKANGARGIVIG